MKLADKEFWKDHARYWAISAVYWKRYGNPQRAEICREWQKMAEKYAKWGRHDSAG